MRSFRLSKNAMEELRAKYPTPFLVASVGKVRDNFNFLREHLPRLNVFYAMKANPNERIIETLAGLGASFDVASGGEMKQLAALGIDGSRMIYANPVKTPAGMETARQLGVDRFTFDDASEIDKIAEAVPGGQVLVRIRVVNKKALVDLNAKFGCAPEEAVGLLQQAKEKGLTPAGIAFHVGSQSLGAAAYDVALLICRRLFDEAEAAGMHLYMLDIGGGLPVPDINGLPIDVARMADQINRQLDRLFPDTELWAEPGRFLCGTAVNLVTSVIGTKERNGQPWYVLDEGLYGAFSAHMYDHWHFAFHSYKSGEREKCTLLGPSCDSIDFVARDVMLPRLEMGDALLVPDCGSYSVASATNFNGFDIASTYIWEDEEISHSFEEEAVQIAANA